MYESLKRIYRNKRNKKTLENAVKRGWITKEQMNQIIAEIEEE